MNDQRNPNSKPRIFDDLRNSLFFTKELISFDIDRAVGEHLDEILDELCDSFSDEMREKFTRAKLCEMCLTTLIDDYEKNKSGSLFVRVTENLRRSNVE
jgi:hypothetical protein